MNRESMIRSAIAGVLAAGVTLGSSALAQDKGQEKCWGVSKTGQNDCGSNKTAHSCQGQSKMDYDPNDFKVVKTGTCLQMGGSLTQGEAGKLAKMKKG